MRTTFNSVFTDTAIGVQESSLRLAKFQQQVATGRRISTASDDPSGSATMITEGAQIASFEQYSRAANSVSSKLTIVDTTMSDIVAKLTAAQSAALSAQGSDVGAPQREAAAQALSGIKAALFDDVNTSFNGTFVFSGGASTTAPYFRNPDGSISAYQGTATEMEVDIDRGRSVRVTYDGHAITQGGAVEDVFTTLDGLVTAARAGDSTGLGQGLAKLQAAFDRATTAQSRVGHDLNVIDDEKGRLDELRQASLARLSKASDTNMAEAISGMNQGETAYRAALGAAGTILRVSLLDYLK